MRSARLRRRRRLIALIAADVAVLGLVLTLVAVHVLSSVFEHARTKLQDANAAYRAGLPITLNPSPLPGAQAALRLNWPLRAHDEFEGSSLDTRNWQPYSGPTTGGVGRHSPDNIKVGGGELQIISHGDQSAGLAWRPGQLYGRWEVRARTEAANGYGPVILLWPDAEDWPAGGEINFMEIPKGARTETHFVVHYGPQNSQHGAVIEGDFIQWHTYAVEWTPDHIAGFIDGQEVFRTTEARELPTRPMHLAIQQDPGPFQDWVPARDATTPASVTLHIDWVRIYGL